jgi:2'-5' RNA ligase
MVRVGTWIEARPKLIIPGIINSRKDECHITLAYLGDVNPEEVAKALQPSDKSVYYNVPYEPILCEAHGTARWVNADGDHVDVLLVSPPIPKLQTNTIYAERDRIVGKLRADGVKVDDLYPFVPHITLPNGWPADPNTILQTLETRVMFAIDKLYVSYTEKDDNGIKATKRIEITKG